MEIIKDLSKASLLSQSLESIAVGALIEPDTPAHDTTMLALLSEPGGVSVRVELHNKGTLLITQVCNLRPQELHKYQAREDVKGNKNTGEFIGHWAIFTQDGSRDTLGLIEQLPEANTDPVAWENRYNTIIDRLAEQLNCNDLKNLKLNGHLLKLREQISNHLEQ